MIINRNQNHESAIHYQAKQATTWFLCLWPEEATQNGMVISITVYK